MVRNAVGVWLGVFGATERMALALPSTTRYSPREGTQAAAYGCGVPVALQLAQGTSRTPVVSASAHSSSEALVPPAAIRSFPLVGL